MRKLAYIAVAGLCAVMAACSQTASNTSNDEVSAAETTETTQAADSSAEAEAADSETIIALEAGDNLVPGELPIVVDFWATWCGPCMQFKPVFHEAAAKYSSKATFASADVDECKALAEKYGISSIPTVLIMMPDGSVKQQTGYMDAAQFDQFLGDIAK